MLPHARHAEIVEHAADRDDQGVVAELPAGNDLGAARIGHRTENDLAPRPVQAAHLAELEDEVVRARVREIVEAVGIRAQGPGGHLVQQRLPDVSESAVDQRDPRLAAPTEPIAELGRENQPARPAADHDDVVRPCQDRPRHWTAAGAPGAGARSNTSATGARAEVETFRTIGAFSSQRAVSLRHSHSVRGGPRATRGSLLA